MMQQSDIKSYWMREGHIFHCPFICNVMSQKLFVPLKKCFHINMLKRRDYPIMKNWDKPSGSSMQVGTTVRGCGNWESFSLDEMMIQYKGTYCPL
jgi:hypothetical protein